MPPIRLLLIHANPPDGIPLALDVEQRNLQDAIQQSGGRGQFEIHVLPAGRIEDIPRYLRRYVPHIVHFACHGDGDGGLRLSAPDDRRGEVLAAAQLAALVREYQAEAAERLRVAVLAGCKTDETARLLAEHLDCAVGFGDDVDDEDLLGVFTPQLYAALGDGRSMPNAVDTACGVLRGRGRDGTADMVRVHRRSGAADSDLRPTAWTPAVLSPAHMDYLKMWFGKPWANVSLADILEENSGGMQRAPLLDVYVPLPVDFSLRIQMQDGKIVDWWARTGQEERAAEAVRLSEAGQERNGESLAEKLAPNQRSWPALGVGESGLQRIVDGIQARLDARRAGGEAADDGEHTWYMEAHDAASVQGRFVLLGEPGSGKSSFLRHLALCLAGELRRRAGDNTAPSNASLTALRDWLLDAYTPIFVEFSPLVRSVFPELPGTAGGELRLPEVEDFWRYVRQSGGGPLADPGGELRKLCSDGRAILLLDGLDEVPQADSQDRRKQILAFMAVLTNAYPDLRMVVAGRPHAYRGGFALDGFGLAELRPLSMDRLSELAHALFPTVLGAEGATQADSFIAAVQQQLADRRIEASFYKNPLFFTLLAGLWLDPKRGRQLPATRAELYRHSVDLLLARWTRRRLPDPSIAESLGLAPDRLRSVLETLACSVHEQSAPGEDTTLFLVKDLLGVLYDAGCEVRMRMGDVPDYLSRHTGLLTSPAHGRLYFTHRSFQEHLAACELICSEPDKHLPPVAIDRRFPAGLVQRVVARPDLWENVGRLAADELAVEGRLRELGNLLAAGVRPYLESGEAPVTTVLALEIAGEQGLFAAHPDDLEVRGGDFKALREAALKVVVDWEHFEPEQRNVAGERLGARPEHDTRRGVGLRPDGLPDIDWVEVPEVDAEGRREFIYQKDELRSERTFWMARYPVTYVQFQAFVDDEDGYRDARWWAGLDAPDDVRSAPGKQGFPFWNHPREGVDWYAAVAFCRWLTWQAQEKRDLLPSALRRRSDWGITLPTEWQWEKAARGHDGRQYPWGGDEYRSGYANIDETYKGGGHEPIGKHYLQKTSAVGMYPQGASPYGICDLSGNVWEWCLNEHAHPERAQEVGSEIRVLRGGSWLNANDLAAAVTRLRLDPDYRDDCVGFRVVVCAVPVP